MQVLFFSHPERAQQLTKGILTEAKTKIRLVNHSESTMQIRLMKASAIGRLVTVCGIVVRIGAVRPQITQMDFTCNKCSTSSTCQFEEGRFTPPQSCPAEGCRSKSFEPLRSSAQSIDWQKIRVQVRAALAIWLHICLQACMSLSFILECVMPCPVVSHGAVPFGRSFKTRTETAAAKFPGQ